jgi:hypothetical protein
MTTAPLTRIFPEPGSIDVEGLLAPLSGGFAACAPPFAADSVAFCAALSRLFLGLPASMGAQWPAIGFFFREAALKQMQRELEATPPPQVRPAILRGPRGLAFHVTPGNVDTQFLYSWLLSILAGNANVVRVSARLSGGALEVCRKIAALAASGDFARIRAGSAVVSYGHDKAITDALSARCDLRILWGGDATIELLRGSPLRPHAKEVAFPDRLSFALIDAARFRALDEAGQRRLVADLANDVYVFDQMACSSPKVLFWRGDDEAVAAASGALFERLAAHLAASGTRVELMTALDKLSFAHGALADGRAERLVRHSNELFVLRARPDAVAALRGAGWGGGLIVETQIGALEELRAHLRPSDQTLTYGCLGREETDALGALALTTGLSRIVPIGRALAFSRHWDGMDLLQELTRALVVEG